jgi:hypothetical protein
MPPEAPVPSAEAAAAALAAGVSDAINALNKDRRGGGAGLGARLGRLVGLGAPRDVRVKGLVLPPFDPFAGDVYSLGLTLWQLWFRLEPFAGQSPEHIAHHVRRGKRLPLHGIPDAPPMPEALRLIIDACWAQVTRTHDQVCHGCTPMDNP